MAGKRRFGRVRKLPSGRFQARYPGPDGLDRPAPTTFATKRDAERWLVLKEAEIQAGDWLAPDAGQVSFKEYAETWIRERPGLRPKTVERYEGLVRLHLVPTFGNSAVADIKDAHVRRWRKRLLDAGVGVVTLAKAYRLLKAVMNTAVSDGMIKRNPCTIKGGGAENSPERPVLSITEVFTLADAIDRRYRALVLLATFTNLRWGEAVALRRKDLDLKAGTVRVERTLVEVTGKPLHFGPPKTEAGTRTLPIPAIVLPDLREHVEKFAQNGDDGLIFVGGKGALLRRANFRRNWLRALDKAGLKGVRFHDLRHTGNTLAAIAGATLPELKARMGHASDRAAMIYLHATDERHREIADTLSAMARAEMKKARKRSGTQRARKRKKKS
ncbi:tyrosine-type recombinase/integrase [Actinomadura litoris]|uniref:Tyrosine-type recombinase/integrase n=1 Tax=Actinomadura litoris TaxID=2678616 RepID=A0A7K1L096_9ACTN|nr:site-specific integrase [Actinomadura litoris]MUN37862.1 tyrosine-type recombinase/integrase [Actinomadura litoris]